MRLAPQVGHLGNLAPHRHDQSAGADQAPGHAAPREPPRRRDTQRARRGLDGRQPLFAGCRVAGEMKALQAARRRLRLLAQGRRHEGARQIGQVGPGVRPVQRPGIHQLACAQRLGDHEVQPAAGAPAEEVAGPNHHAVQAASGALRQQRLDLAADASLAGGRVLHRVLRQHRGHRLAVVVDIAGQHEGRVQAASQVHALARQLEGLALPAVIRRIDRMDHRAHALRQRHQHRVTRGHRQMADTGRQAGGQAARLRQHRMAGRREGMDRRQAEAPAGAKHENRRKRSRHRGIPR